MKHKRSGKLKVDGRTEDKVIECHFRAFQFVEISTLIISLNIREKSRGVLWAL